MFNYYCGIQNSDGELKIKLLEPSGMTITEYKDMFSNNNIKIISSISINDVNISLNISELKLIRETINNIIEFFE